MDGFLFNQSINQSIILLGGSAHWNFIIFVYVHFSKYGNPISLNSQILLKIVFTLLVWSLLLVCGIYFRI